MIAKRVDDQFEDLADANPEALLADGLEEAYIGLTVNHHHPVVAVYDYDKCMRVLTDEGLTEDEASEYLEFNTLGAYVGTNGHLFVRITHG